MHTKRCRVGGFTIVELLTVIAIIVILMGLLVSALAGARKSSFKTRELNAIRQIGLAWSVYANSNGDSALPGWIDPPVQTLWKLEFDFPSGDLVPAELAASWPFRLLPFLDNNHDMVHGYADEDDSDPLSWQIQPPPPAVIPDDWEAYEIANEPSFGYNAHYVGGWWTMTEMGTETVPRYAHYDARADVNGDGSIGPNERVNVVSRSPSTMKRSTEVVVFASSSNVPLSLNPPLSAPYTYDKVRPDIAGSHWISPSWIGQEQQWRLPELGGQRITDVLIEVLEESPTPIGRYTGNAAVLYADLHNNAVLPGTLADQRAFIDAADRANWTHE